MSKKIKKIALAIIAITVVICMSIGTASITKGAQSAGSDVTTETIVTTTAYTRDNALVLSGGRITYSASLKALSSSVIPFEVLDFTNKQSDDISEYYDNYTFFATNDPTYKGNTFGRTFKWFGKNIILADGTISYHNSRLAIAKLYKVTPGSSVSFLLAKSDSNNKGGAMADARILFAEYDKDLNLINDGAWVSARDRVDLNKNTYYVAIIIRYQDGSGEIGSGTNTTVGWTASDNLNLANYPEAHIIFKPFTYYVDKDGNGSYETEVLRYGTEDITNNSDAQILISNTTAKTGYRFSHWQVGTTGTDFNISTNWKYSENANKLKGRGLVNGVEKDVYYDKYFQNLYFKAVYNPNTYYVAYNSNKPSGATGSVSGSMSNNNIHTYDTAKNLTANAYSLAGYTFNGWNTKADGTGTAYADKASVKNLTSTNGATVTLYAQWKPNSYTITLNAPDATNSYTKSLTATFDKAYPSISVLPQRKYTVKFDSNGGSSVASQTVTYTFNGYYTASSGGTQHYTSSGSAKNAKYVTVGNLPLYAQWTAKSVTLSTPTRTGYKFAGWKVGNNIYTTTYTPTANITLVAQWTPITYTIEYNKNKPSTAISDVTGTTASSSHTYDTAKTLTANGYSLAGYTFKGWNTKADGTGTSYADKASVKNLTATAGATITLYAQWEDNSSPTISDNYTPGNCNSVQEFTITIKDIGSTIKSYTISGAGVEAINGSLSGSNLTTNTVIVKVKVKNAGTLTVTATDGAGKTSSASKTFIKTYLNNNQGNITGNDKVATDNFSSIAGNVCHSYTLNTSGETVTPVSPSRKGCENIGWASSANATVGNDVIITNGGTYYVVWKDIYKPVINVSVYEENGWKLKFDLFDTNNNTSSTYTGSDIAGYYLGSNSNYTKNQYYPVECKEDGSATGIVVEINMEETPELYLNAVDKAGNVSANTDAVTTFRRVTLATRITDGTTSYAKFDYDGKNDLAIYTFYVLNGTKITFPEARREGYHGTSDPNKSNISTTWTTEDNDDVIGITEAIITSNVVFYPTFVPNVYEITYNVNMPKDNSTITNSDTEKLIATNDKGLYMSEFILTPLNAYVTYEGKDIATQFINDDTIPSDAVFNQIPKILSAKGWNFLGWYDDEAYTVTYDLTKVDNDVYESEAIKVYNNECKASSELYWNEYGWINDSDVALYAHWMVNKYIINYNNNANDGSHCIIEHSNVTGELNTVAEENKQIALYDTYVELSKDNTLKKVAESKETNYLLGKEIGIIKDTQYVTVGQIQAWSLDANTKALEDEANVSKQIGASNAGKDTVYTNICKNLTDSSEVTVYAVWDHAPQFEKKSFYILSDKFDEFKEDDGFKYKEFSEHILNNVIILDPEDGMPETIKTSDWKETFDKSIIDGKLSTELDTYVYTMDAKDNGKIILSFIDIEETVSQLLTFTTNASCQVKVDIVDTFGNVMHDQITIHFRSSDANEDIETGVNAPTLFTRTQFTRAINKKFFSNSFLDTTDWSNYKELGALRPTSIWINNPEYKNALETALHNLENNIYEASYSFTRDQVLATQMYTYGKIVYDEITERYNIVVAERVKGLLNGRYTDEGHQITNINKDGKGSVNEVLGTYNELLREWGVK